MIALRLVGLVVLTASTVACDAGRESREQQQVARLCRAEQQLRDAANADKPRFLAEMARLPCPTVSACQLRDSCTSAYTLHVDALALTRAAKQRIADGRGAEAAGILNAAQSKLALAGAQVSDCTALASSTRRTHRID